MNIELTHAERQVLAKFARRHSEELYLAAQKYDTGQLGLIDNKTRTLAEAARWETISEYLDPNA